MLTDHYTELEEWIKDKRAAASRENERQEFGQLFQGLNEKVDSLSESVKAFVESTTPNPLGSGGEGDGGGASPPAVVPPPVAPVEEPAPELPLERVRRLPVPRVYTGDDEPGTVKYIDPDTGEEKTRNGRRKGHPSGVEVESVELPADPVEPEADAAA